MWVESTLTVGEVNGNAVSFDFTARDAVEEIARRDTHEAALAAVKQATALWLETAQATGRALPKARGGRLLFV